MSVEVRQLVIKSNVVQTDEQGESGASPAEDLENFKMEIINECKRMIAEQLRDKRER